MYTDTLLIAESLMLKRTHMKRFRLNLKCSCLVKWPRPTHPGPDTSLFWTCSCHAACRGCYVPQATHTAPCVWAPVLLLDVAGYCTGQNIHSHHAPAAPAKSEDKTRIHSFPKQLPSSIPPSPRSRVTTAGQTRGSANRMWMLDAARAKLPEVQVTANQKP